MIAAYTCKHCQTDRSLEEIREIRSLVRNDSGRVVIDVTIDMKCRKCGRFSVDVGTVSRDELVSLREALLEHRAYGKYV